MRMKKANDKNEMTKLKSFTLLKNSEQFSDDSINSFEKAVFYEEYFIKTETFFPSTISEQSPLGINSKERDERVRKIPSA